jgi:hypothetical protein
MKAKWTEKQMRRLKRKRRKLRQRSKYTACASLEARGAGIRNAGGQDMVTSVLKNNEAYYW